MTALAEFVAYADEARAVIPPSRVSWAQSPFAWMRHHGPRTKSKMGRDIVRAWLRTRPVKWEESDDGVSHFTIAGHPVVVHLSLQGKEGMLEFANLREPGMGADLLLLIGIEPHRARIWAAYPRSMRELPSYKNDAPGYHNCSVDPDDPPEWLIERECWVAVNGGQP